MSTEIIGGSFRKKPDLGDKSPEVIINAVQTAYPDIYIPEPTQDDKKYLLKILKKRKSVRLKSLVCAARDEHVFRVAALLLHNTTLNDKDKIDVLKKSVVYNAAERAILNDNKRGHRYEVLRMILAADNHVDSAWQYKSRIIDFALHDWRSFKLFCDHSFLDQGNIVSAFCKTVNGTPIVEEKIRFFLSAGIDPNIESYKIISETPLLKVLIDCDQAFKLQTEKNFYIAKDNGYKESFHLLCQTKYDRENNGGPVLDIPIADEYIKQHFKKAPKDTLTEAQKQGEPVWEKIADAIVRRTVFLPNDEGKLRDYFDFAAKRMRQVQEDHQGIHALFNEVINADTYSPLVDEARIELHQQNGTPDYLPKSIGTLNPLTITSKKTR